MKLINTLTIFCSNFGILFCLAVCPYNCSVMVSLYDILNAIPITSLTIVFDKSFGVRFVNDLTKYLQNKGLTTNIYNIEVPNGNNKLDELLLNAAEQHESVTTLYLCKTEIIEDTVLELYDKNFVQRQFLYIFYWRNEPISRRFVRQMQESLKIMVITNPRENAYRVYFNQATSHRKHSLKLVNWWIEGIGLYKRPTLPAALKVFSDFQGKTFRIPVVHKPPWHFVKYNDNNSNIQVEGGRDDKLLAVIAEKLNFRYEYYDPPDRSQGSSIMMNGSFQGVLGLIWRREADFFLGDVAITLERSFAVEFSFLTLADSGAFITHAPGRLNEAMALIRPFQWEVWPPVIIVMIISGPILYSLIIAPTFWRKRRRLLLGSRTRLFKDCVWFTTTIFLRQTGKEPSKDHKVRFFTIILSFAATYVIGDMYSANLTSLLARPGREKPISTLSQLEDAMLHKGFQLYVERHSSSFQTLENGTGIYSSLWHLMQNQKQFLIDSVEAGVKMVRDSKNIAIIAGRETLYFDSRRFGPNYFYLSEKLYTGYSAIAFQYGCPYIENFNKILIHLFEAGILTKMTEEEYEKLGKRQLIESEANENPINDRSIKTENSANSFIGSQMNKKTKATIAIEEERKSEPISLKMLQGAFYILLAGELFSLITFFGECMHYKHKKKFVKKKKRIRKKRCKCPFHFKKNISYFWNKIHNWLKIKWHEATDDVSLYSIEYCN